MHDSLLKKLLVGVLFFFAVSASAFEKQAYQERAEYVHGLYGNVIEIAGKLDLKADDSKTIGTKNNAGFLFFCSQDRWKRSREDLLKDMEADKNRQSSAMPNPGGGENSLRKRANHLVKTSYSIVSDVIQLDAAREIPERSMLFFEFLPNDV